MDSVVSQFTKSTELELRWIILFFNVALFIAQRIHSQDRNKANSGLEVGQRIEQIYRFNNSFDCTS